MRLGIILVGILLVGCVKAPVVVAPIVGWQTQEGWIGECYYPPNFDELGLGDRRQARQDTLEAIYKQWSSESMGFDPDLVEDAETVLLGEPDEIDAVSVINLKHCMTAMSGGGTSGWTSWLRALPAKLTEGECKNAPLKYTLYDYLNISGKWQIPAGVCEGDVIRISGSSKDFYKVTESGDWINVSGVPDEHTTTSDFPCNFEGCLLGQLIMRFTDENGISIVRPVGERLTWTAPSHGEIEVMINDVDFSDNVYKVQSGITHHTSITYNGDL
jgi:hypothetical protein